MDLTLFGTCDSAIGQDKPSSKPELNETSTAPRLKSSVPTLEDLLTTSPKEIDSGYSTLSYIPSDAAGVEMETPRLPFDSPVCKKDSPPVDMSSAAPQTSNETWNLDKGRSNETAIAVASISEFASIPTAVEKGINKIEVCGGCSPTLPWERPENTAVIGIAQSVHPSGNGEPQLVVSMPNISTTGQDFSEKSISIQRNDSIATSYTVQTEEHSSPTNSEQPVSYSAFQMRSPQQSKHHGDYSIFQLPYNETTALSNANQLNGMPFTNEDAVTLPSVAQDIGFSQPSSFGLGTERFCADETAKMLNPGWPWMLAVQTQALEGISRCSAEPLQSGVYPLLSDVVKTGTQQYGVTNCCFEHMGIQVNNGSEFHKSAFNVLLPNASMQNAYQQTTLCNTPLISDNGTDQPAPNLKLVDRKSTKAGNKKYNLRTGMRREIRSQPMSSHGRYGDVAEVYNVDERSSKNQGSSRNKPLNELASSLMDQWYCGHLDHPYPTNEEKWQFAMLGGITVAQVSSWFANRRTRTSNTKPKKNRSLLLRKLQDFCGELERASHGLLNASDIEQRFQALFNEFHP
ncbi:pre-B-cell leukemia transcription factor 1 [Clonorchis sinensis]|uniref:Pre-B-cell leukemia transcription factor 1 n=1 Tax=Clonorchis sinensis TaxID=79923 RepID=G7YSD3_CLOSI|nr:pre-B-cell leukemia transcription factor 1 [Clonorchis sinensis]